MRMLQIPNPRSPSSAPSAVGRPSLDGGASPAGTPGRAASTRSPRDPAARGGGRRRRRARAPMAPRAAQHAPPPRGARGATEGIEAVAEGESAPGDPRRNPARPRTPCRPERILPGPWTKTAPDTLDDGHPVDGLPVDVDADGLEPRRLGHPDTGSGGR